MINFPDIRSAIVRPLAATLGIRVIEMNVAAPIPPYPFITYEFDTDIGERIGHPAVTYADGKRIWTETVTFTVSFLSYAVTKSESVERALAARNWFMGPGRMQLREAVNVVIVTVGSIENRDVQLGDQWERRNGFDVEFRTTNQIEEIAEFIETTDIKGDE